MLRFRLLLLFYMFSFAACSLEEGNREQMVDLQHVKDDPDTQLVNLNAAIDQAGSDGSLYARRATVLLQKGELQQALSDADKAVKLTGNEPYALYVKAKVLWSLGRLKEAFPLALQAERNSYQSSSLYMLLGDLYQQRKEYGQAREYLNKAKELSPNNEVVFYRLGRVAEATGDTAAAVANYKRASNQAPAYMEPKRELSGLLIAQNEVVAAKPYIASALKTAPEDGLLWYYQGLVYQSEQKRDSATHAFNKAVSLADTLQGAHYILGLQQYAQGHNGAALEHLQKAASYEKLPVYTRTIAIAYERTGQFVNALASYQRLAEQEPQNTYAYQAISRLKYKIKEQKPEGAAAPQAQTEQ